MASAEVSTPRKRHSFLRFWLPLSILVLGSAGVTTIALWPAPEVECANRVSSTIGAGMLVFMLLIVWFLFLSGLRWSTRIVTLLVPLALGAGSIRGVSFDGDMRPTFRFRWSPSQDERLEAFRKGLATPAATNLAAAIELKETDYPEYRGRNRDGVANMPTLARDWKAHPPRLLWHHPVGAGYASFAVAGDVAVTIEQRRDNEAVVCYDAASGLERWSYEYPAHFQEPLGGPGPRATPTISGGNVYSLGATGMLVCLELATGKPIWSVDLLEDNDNAMWAMSGSPLVFDDVVVVNPGAQRTAAEGSALIAFDNANGKKVWSSGNTRAGYASPMLATLAGRRQILIFDGAGLGGYDAKTGTELWRYKWEVMNGINVAQPLVLDGDRIFVTTAYGVGCGLLQISLDKDKWSQKDLLADEAGNKNKAMRCKISNPVAYQAHVYGLDDGILTCMDLKTGKRSWRDGRYGHGQLVLSGDLLVVLTENGKLVLVKATPEGHQELGSIQALEKTRTWNCPALADGKVYIRNDAEMACYDLTGN